MGTCYNIVYNESTSAFEKHGGTVLVTGLHTCGYWVDITEPLNTELNLSADFSVTSANDDMLPTAITSAEEQTSGVPDINVTINSEVLEMRLKLQITLISPVVKVDYLPLEKVKADGIVKR